MDKRRRLKQKSYSFNIRTDKILGVDFVKQVPKKNCLRLLEESVQVILEIKK